MAHGTFDTLITVFVTALGVYLQEPIETNC